MNLPESQQGDPTLERIGAKGLGAFYTPRSTAEVMARWILETSPSRVLEPSVGEGVFIQALRHEAADAGVPAPEILGVEIAPDTYADGVDAGILDPGSSRNCDFLSITGAGVDAAVGNPPYVRLRHTDAGQRERALAVAGSILDQEMDPAGSLWMPFVLNAARMIRPGGRMAFVLPFELTHVRYARPLWSYLGRNFGGLKLIRVRERMFDDILQETVLLYASEKGGKTEGVEFEIFQTLGDLDRGTGSASTRLEIADIVAGRRLFTQGHLSAGLRTLLAGISDRLHPSTESVTWRIGYVSGDKEFFHPDREKVKALGLSTSSLTPALVSGREIGKQGITTGEARAERFLFSPQEDEEELAPGDRGYVDQGEMSGVDDRYKCRIRSPWYQVPHVRVPDLVLPVFGQDPHLVVNDGGYVASNSYMCGYVPEGVSVDGLVASWYCSLTLLEAELQVHSLGGGVLVFVPRELSAIRLARPGLIGPDLADRRMRELRASEDRSREYGKGDELVLQRCLGLDSGDIGLIREGVEELRSWRTGAERKPEPYEASSAIAV